MADLADDVKQNFGFRWKDEEFELWREVVRRARARARYKGLPQVDILKQLLGMVPRDHVTEDDLKFLKEGGKSPPAQKPRSIK